MNNGIFTIKWINVGDAFLTAIVSAVLVAFVSVVTTSGFDVFTADWGTIGHNMVNLGFIAGTVSLGKDFFSTGNGSLLGIGPVSG